MKKILLFLIFLTISSCSKNDESPELERIKSNGEWLSYEVGSKTPFTGDITSFYTDGQIKSSESYKKGKRDGLRLSYYPSGQLKYKSLYRNGDRESIERYFADGSIEEKDITVDGKRTYERYYANGQLRQKWFYINGVREGLSEEYWENGLPESKSMYKNGKFNGLVQIYNEYGVLIHNRVYKDNVVQPRQTKKPKMTSAEELVHLSNKTSLKQTQTNNVSRLVECRDTQSFSSDNVLGDPRSKLGKIRIKTKIFDFDKMTAVYLSGVYENKKQSIFDYKLNKKDIVIQNYNPDQKIFYITEENDIFINFRTIFDETFDKRTMKLFLTKYWERNMSDPDATKCRYLNG